MAEDILDVEVNWDVAYLWDFVLVQGYFALIGGGAGGSNFGYTRHVW